MKLMKSRALMAGFCAILLSSLSTKATVIFPIADSPNVVQVCGGLACDGTNYLAALAVGKVGAAAEIGAQLVSPAGTDSGSLLNVGTGSVWPPQEWPMAAFGGGAFLEVWSDTNLTSGVDMFGQRISAGGTKLGSSFPLLASRGTNGFQRVLALGFGATNFLAVWQDGTSGYYYGQIVKSAGGLFGTNFLISGQRQKDTNWAAVAFDGTNYLTVWQSNTNEGVGTDAYVTYGEFISSSGSPGSPFQISQTASLDTDPLAIAFDGTNYLVVWCVDTLHDSNSRALDRTLYGRLVSPGGALSASEVVLAGDPGNLSYDNQCWPNLAFDGQDYLLVWTHYTATGETNVSYLTGQFFDRSLNAVGTNFAAMPALGTNRPVLAFNGLVYDGTRFVLAGAYGRMTINANGKLNGIVYWQTWGVFIPTNLTLPTIVAGPTSTTNLEGTTATLTAVVEGSALDYQWLKNGAKLGSSSRISGVNSASLTISNLALADTGAYSLMASNLFGTAISSNATLTVVPPVVITLQSSPAKVATLTGGGTYMGDSPVMVTATVTNGCYYFTNWTVSGKVVSTNSTCLFVANNSETLVANFSPFLYEVQALSNPANGGTASGGGAKNCGSLATVTATAKTGFRFTNWTVGATVASTNANYPFTVQGNVQLTANFVDVSVPTLTITAPTANEKVATSLLAISGTANNVLGVGSVVLTLNGEPVSAASTNNWTNWSAGVILKTGTNVISAYAESEAGHPSKTATVTVQETGTPGYAPVSLAGLIANVENSTEGQRVNSYGTATMEHFSLEPGQGSGVANYTYTQTGSNTATLVTSYFAPPDKATNGTSTDYLTFTSPTTANITKEDSTNTGTLALSPGLGFDISSQSGFTYSSIDPSNNTSITVFRDGTFTRTNGGGTVVSGSYTSTQYGPMAAMIVMTYAVPGTDGVDTNYSLVMFASRTNGIHFDTYYDAAGDPPQYESGTFTGLYEPSGLKYLAPESLNGMSAQVTQNATVSQPSATFTSTFGEATLGQTPRNTNDNDAGVLNYTYARTGAKTAVLYIYHYLPPPSGGADNRAISLTFQSSESATWVSSGGDQQEVTGTISFSVLPQAGYFAPAALPQGVTIVGGSGSGSATLSLNYGSFTNLGTSTRYGAYTYAQFSPTVGMLIETNADPANAGELDYIQLTFSSSTSGSFYKTKASDGSITLGTFSIK